MASWGEFEAASPELAARARGLIYQGPVGYGFLATVRSHDGGPRLHPVCPIVGEGRLWVFVVDLSPKYHDLLKDSRYALHSFPRPEGGEELYLTGEARRDERKGAREAAIAASGGLLGGHGFEKLFELEIGHVLHVGWANWGSAQTWPEYTRWKAL